MLIIKGSLIVWTHPWCLQRLYSKNPTADNEKQVEFQWGMGGVGGKQKTSSVLCNTAEDVTFTEKNYEHHWQKFNPESEANDSPQTWEV